MTCQWTYSSNKSEKVAAIDVMLNYVAGRLDGNIIGSRQVEFVPLEVYLCLEALLLSNNRSTCPGRVMYWFKSSSG